MALSKFLLLSFTFPRLQPIMPPMKRVYIALAVLAVSLAGMLVRQVAQPRETEPMYQGKPLIEWLEACPTCIIWFAGPVPYDFSPRAGVSPLAKRNAEEALRQAGTNAIPTLLRLLRSRDSALKLKLIPLVQHLVKIKYASAGDRNSTGCWGFYILGADAQPATQELVQIAKQNISDPSRSCALLALNFVAPSANSPMMRWVPNADANLSRRRLAMSTLPRIDPEAAAKAGITNIGRNPLLPP